ncbi:tyrosine-protein kinase STYK1 isoform X2 [Denticeps clupeoides]|uniref:tyrosine-protein kinase STYK1 isoform X2 n=1 Tax=Denticeps clupeoides TaxID=299321 RepID=UPI0010A50FA7|nr:tyrosine-protein kinase STYK1-like isoform X2 [Denticeps clupeoides]
MTPFVSSEKAHRSTGRQHLQGIEAPPELDPLEHEVIALSNTATTSAPAVPTPSSPRHYGSFQLVTPLPMSFLVKRVEAVSLYRARMDQKGVILHVLKDNANGSERQDFLGFANFLSELGSHPFLPSILGVVSVSIPNMMVVEELEHRDLLGYLWRCREDQLGAEGSCDITERQIFTMAEQTADALEYLHGQNCIHGNIRARSVLVGRDLTAKLWGFGPAYRRLTQPAPLGPLELMEMRKWQPPEVLAQRPATQSSDMWSFGILLYEMVTLGDPPFPQIMATDLLQHLQRNKTLKRPAACSTSLYSIIKACCQWRPQDRASLREVRRSLQSGERGANGTAVIRVHGALDVEKYMREAGYGEAYNYALL